MSKRFQSDRSRPIGEYPAVRGPPRAGGGAGARSTRTSSHDSTGGRGKSAEICIYWQKGSCKNGPSCRFQHDSSAREGGKAVSRPVDRGPTARRETSALRPPKVEACKFWQKGSCKNGSSCRFRHGAREKRASRAAARPVDPGPIDEDLLKRIQAFVSQRGAQVEGGQIGAFFKGIKKSQLEPHFEIITVGRGKYWVRERGFDGPQPEAAADGADDDVFEQEGAEEEVNDDEFEEHEAIEQEQDEEEFEEQEACQSWEDDDMQDDGHSHPEEGGDVQDDVQSFHPEQSLEPEEEVEDEYGQDDGHSFLPEEGRDLPEEGEEDADDEYTESLLRKVEDLRRKLAEARARLAQKRQKASEGVSELIEPSEDRGSTRGTKRKACAFWAKGFCRNGEECPFAHNGSRGDVEALDEDTYWKVRKFIEDHGGFVEGGIITNAFRFIKRAQLEDRFQVTTESKGKFTVRLP
eukprot:TRINITY_DN64105_c0_g1_i1.p1 TRINITY_DN64105_c0_g1~~TRINITY_DN64105_c0_g1_i1.p1  ORF type:complete len:464 (+),score=110.12 TRINITY_DN64105_c0_g1_i1:89-1480(+)